jgi:flavin-dependent dehydrogenase
MSTPLEYDVIVVGGGPAGSSVSTHLARGGLRVGLFERAPFPRFHEGESLLPATLPILDRLGVHDTVAARGFQIKYGASFSDQESNVEKDFFFLERQPWPNHSYEVPRGEFDTILLEHARKQGVVVHQPAAVSGLRVEDGGVSVTVMEHGETLTARGAFLVDASGRDGFLATRIGQRERVPNLGKVALFAHFRGGARVPGRGAGNIQIHVFEDGWFWYIPFSTGVTSVGSVLHAKTIRAWQGSQEDLYAEMIRRCRRVAANLRGAERITPVQPVANFAYVNRPVVGDRFLAVGDAVAFVDPIFSTGVHIALQSGELAAQAVLQAFATRRFEAASFAAYERAVWRGVRPFFKFIHRYYEPAFFELFLRPRNVLGVLNSVLFVLSGGAFLSIPWKTRFGLSVLFGLARVKTWRRRWTGKPVESRLEW